MPAPYRAITVANEFVRLAEDAGGRRLTPMQLVKLTYIAHGWSLALLERPLISDRVEAWKFGPVIPELYHKVKHFGSEPVRGGIHPGLFGREALEDDDQELVEEVYDKYGDLSGIQLSHLTHKPDTPWFQMYDPDGWGITIPNKLIKRHYVELAEQD